MLIDRITDLCGDLPETMTNPDYIFEVSAREVLDKIEDTTVVELKSRKFVLSEFTPTFNAEKRKILLILRHDVPTSLTGIECEEMDFVDLNKFVNGSGHLDEATAYSPVYSIAPLNIQNADLNLYSGEISIYPALTENSTADIYYIDYPRFPEDLDVMSYNNLIDDTDGTVYDYWTPIMEEAFIIRSAMRILQIKLNESNIEEEDAEVSQLVENSLQHVSSEWQRIKGELSGSSPEEQERFKSMNRG